MLQVLKEKVASLSDNHKNALAANIDEIVYTSTGDISIYYDEKGNAGRGNFTWPLIVQINQSSEYLRIEELCLCELTFVALQSLYHFSSLQNQPNIHNK